MSARRRRLDAELVRRDLAPSRSAARRLVESGSVLVGGSVATKADRMVLPGDALVVVGEGPRFVGRAGEKLHAALEEFGLDPEGLEALDAGASTGGFTDCLLQHGAEHVVALDVGHGQLHESLRGHDRVTVLERTNLRHCGPEELGHFDAVVADLSFISLTAVMEVLLSVARPGAWLVLLVKPQFECGRAEASRGRGVVRDPEVWVRTLETVMNSAAEHRGVIMGAMVSPLRGGDGNVEFLVHVRAPVEHGPRATGHEGSLGSLARTVVESVPAGGSGG
ncbi:MAG: TlyA family RNA methyltransferase [Microthrixaceae bacterium]|nr:TlyA family RNA methyltransferase [Microthrixaceae bacterium]